MAISNPDHPLAREVSYLRSAYRSMAREIRELRLIVAGEVDPLTPKPKRKPSVRGARAYELRCRGLTWNAVAGELGITTRHGKTHACGLARSYAHHAGLLWPPPVQDPTRRATEGTTP